VVTDTPMPRLILASRSQARRAMLTGAGVAHIAQDSGLDEDVVKAAHPELDPASLALELARAKALAVSTDDPDAWVLGSDQTLAFGGGLMSKAADLTIAHQRLRAMAGRVHHLHSAAALAHAGSVVWSGVDTARMTMRAFSDDFLDAYLEVEGTHILACVGSYRLEGMGAQLFASVEGDYFTVLGMPLWPVLEALRQQGVIGT